MTKHPKSAPSAPDWRKDHWRQYEHPQDHAERVERAEAQAARWFDAATARQKAVWDRAMADLKGLDAPRYERAREAARAEWYRSTKEAADLMEVTAAEIMRDGEVLPEIADLWDQLEKRQTEALQTEVA